MLITKQILEKSLPAFAFPAKQTKWYKDLAPTDCVQIDVFSREQFKSLKQNALFHSLLNTFWLSGCSSFESADAMRRHYKEMAGLITREHSILLDEQTKVLLWNRIKTAPISDQARQDVINLLRGDKIIEKSWADATKEGAKNAIDALIHDMDEAGVVSSEKGNNYQAILNSIGAGICYEH